MAASEKLTDREKEVLRLISLGCTMEESGAILGLSPSTIDNHKTRIMNKIGTNKITLLVRFALKMKVSSLSDKLTNSEKRKSGRRNDGWN